MAKASSSLRLWLLLGLGGVATWQLGSYFFRQPIGPEKLVNQLWIERMPTNPRDMIWHLVALERDGRRVGALGRSSSWRLMSDGFIWNRQGDQFSFHTPQNGCKSQLKIRTWKCAGEAPKPFELCLELEGQGKRYRYFSREDWQIRPRVALDPSAAFAASAVQTALAVPSGPEPSAAAGACPAADVQFGPISP
jgi:hypothetical protein